MTKTSAVAVVCPVAEGAVEPVQGGVVEPVADATTLVPNPAPERVLKSVPPTQNRKVDWTTADDLALAQAMADNIDLAWREFYRRYVQLIDKRIKWVAKKTAQRFKTSETILDIRAEVYSAFLVNDRSRLRAFDPKRGTLASWIGRIAHQTAVNHLKKEVRRPLPQPEEAIAKLQEELEEGTARAAWWVANHGW